MNRMRAAAFVAACFFFVGRLNGADWEINSGFSEQDRVLQQTPTPPPAYDAARWITPIAYVRPAVHDPQFLTHLEPPPSPPPTPPIQLEPLYEPLPPNTVGSAFDPGLYPAQMDYAGCESCVEACCTPRWAHRSGVFGEFLYWRPRDAEVTYAVPIDGGIIPPGTPPIQVGQTATADPDFAGGFRVGFTYALSDCSSLTATYTQYENNGFDSAAADGVSIVLRDMVLHPATANAGSDFTSVSSNFGVDLDLADIDYRGVWSCSELHAVNYLVGVRYARLDQNFEGNFIGAGVDETLITDVNFDGIGLRLGVDAERHARHSGWLVYGKSNVSFLAGEFRGHYFQGNTVDPVIVDTYWQAGRLVSILDLEVGVGWQSQGGRLRWTVGYTISAWFNTVSTDSDIQAVRTTNFVNPEANITFDGLTTRLEYRF